jgi:hypothetical protein
MSIHHPYALDFGVTATGKTSFIEVNDAWAAELYENCLTLMQYVKFLTSRWHSLLTFNHKEFL